MMARGEAFTFQVQRLHVEGRSNWRARQLEGLLQLFGEAKVAQLALSIAQENVLGFHISVKDFLGVQV